jgi:hypothetical protein
MELRPVLPAGDRRDVDWLDSQESAKLGTTHRIVMGIVDAVGGFDQWRIVEVAS